MLLKIRYCLPLVALLLSGCGITYLAQAARGQLAVLRARQPIDRVLARPDTSSNLKTQLLRAKRIRDYASQDLGLPDNAAYRSYADIGRRYVVWNVVAAPELSIRPLQWCFPIAGCVAYRGYFSEQAARDFATTLHAQGNDVTVGGVPAYSTLGRLADPLLSSVTGYSELDLAALVFHELAHQLVYLPGDSSFNEAFATTVEEAGVSRYAASLDAAAGTGSGAQALARWQARGRMRVALTQLFATARTDLGRLYAGHGSVEEKRAGKAQRLQQLADDIHALEQREGRSSGVADWLAEGLNNAHLASMGTYYDRVPEFEQLLHGRCHDSLPCLYAAAREMAARQEAAAEKRRPHAKVGPR